MVLLPLGFFGLSLKKEPGTSQPGAQITQLVHPGTRPHDIVPVPLPLLLPLGHPREHAERAPEPALDPKADVRVQPIADHARPRPLKLEPLRHGIHHLLAGLAERFGLAAPERGNEGRGAGARAGEDGLVRGEGDVRVCGEEDGAPLREVVVRVRELEVAEVEVEPAEDDADGRVKRRAVGEGAVVRGGDGALVGGVCTADVAEGLGGEFGLDAGFADDEDGASVGGEGQDARDVDGGGVGGRKDFILEGKGGRWKVSGGSFQISSKGNTNYRGRDAHPCELLLVVGAGFGAVVGDEDDLLAWMESLNSRPK